jgi:hypothetical protein
LNVPGKPEVPKSPQTCKYKNISIASDTSGNYLGEFFALLGYPFAGAKHEKAKGSTVHVCTRTVSSINAPPRHTWPPITSRD